MKLKKVLIFVLLISVAGFLAAGLGSWFDPAAWKKWLSGESKEVEVNQVSLFGNNSSVNYFHDLNQTLDIAKSKSDWDKIADKNTYSAAILYIYSVLQTDKELKSSIFDFNQVQEVFDNQAVPVISADIFDIQIQDVIRVYQKRKAAKAIDNTCLSDANISLSKIEKEIIQYLIKRENTVDDELINLAVSLTILNII